MKASLILAATLGLAGCSASPSAAFLEALAKDQAGLCLVISPVPPYFGGMTIARTGSSGIPVECPGAKIGGQATSGGTIVTGPTTINQAPTAPPVAPTPPVQPTPKSELRLNDKAAALRSMQEWADATGR